ncbi:contractile injection system protein, VgrG/Pvc8 family [Streptomyces werraensis]|uniref:contractile injection system protein, VgrG/Pvc8 family n=1 Tax=Streptomyces werraensis TaxID=68284 RepID=UPI00342DB3AE
MAWRRAHRPHLYARTPALERGAWLSGVEIYQAEGAHQVAELTVMHTYNTAFPSQRWRTPAGSVWPENTPVRLQYGWYADDSADWYGYVASSRVLGSETHARYGYAVQVPVVYTLTGASMPMQTRRNRTWSSATASSVARQVAREYNLQPHVETTGYVFPQSAQASSDWQYLVELADRVGFRLFCDGTTLHFTDRRTILRSSDGSWPVFHQRKTPGSIDSLREFDAVVGDTDPAGGLRARYETTAFNRTSNVLTDSAYAQARSTAQGQPVSPLLTTQYTGRPADSYAQSQRLLGAEADWLWVWARAVTNGDPRLRPGSLVELRGAGLGDAHQGVWMVRSAVHKLGINHVYPQKSTYTTSLVVGRDDARTLSVGVQNRQVRPAPTVLVSGRWRASYTGGGAV